MDGFTLTDTHEGFVVVEIFEPLSEQLATQVIKAYWRAGVANSLTDLTRSSVQDFSTAESIGVSNFVKANRPKDFPVGVHALLVDDPLMYGVMRMVAAYVERAGVKFIVGYEREPLVQAVTITQD